MAIFGHVLRAASELNVLAGSTSNKSEKCETPGNDSENEKMKLGALCANIGRKFGRVGVAVMKGNVRKKIKKNS